MYTNATFNSVASNFTFLSVLSTGIPPNRVLVYKSPINFKCTVPGATCSALADFYISDMLTVPQMAYIDCWLAQDYGWKLFGQGQMTSYCSLRGISCGSNTSSVTEIMFQSSAMAGSIPSSIGNLVNLTKLDVHSTLMSGDIPTTELFNLPKLTYLDLSYTKLSGSLPATYTSPSFDPTKSTFTYLNVASTLIAPNKLVVQKSSAVKAGHSASFVFALTCTFVLLADYLV
jgi:Leucine-rich repeat (LRR) protein